MSAKRDHQSSDRDRYQDNRITHMDDNEEDTNYNDMIGRQSLRQGQNQINKADIHLRFQQNHFEEERWAEHDEPKSRNLKINEMNSFDRLRQRSNSALDGLVINDNQRSAEQAVKDKEISKAMRQSFKQDEGRSIVTVGQHPMETAQRSHKNIIVQADKDENKDNFNDQIQKSSNFHAQFSQSSQSLLVDNESRGAVAENNMQSIVHRVKETYSLNNRINQNTLVGTRSSNLNVLTVQPQKHQNLQQLAMKMDTNK